MPRAVKTKMMGGRMVSAKSKTGDPQCSAAASAWQNSLRGNPVGMALDVAMKVLGQCRAKARMLKSAQNHRNAGNDLKAKVLEKRAQGGGPVSAKDRLAKARELKAGRTADIMNPNSPRNNRAFDAAVARRKAETDSKRNATRAVVSGRAKEMGKTYSESDYHLEQSRKLSPPGGTIAVGGAHYDEFSKGEGLATFLRHIGKGKTPARAAELTRGEMAQSVAKWNASRGKDWQTHRWEGANQDGIDAAMRKVAAIKSAPARANPKQAAGASMDVYRKARQRYAEAGKAAMQPKGFKKQSVQLATSNKEQGASVPAQVKGVYAVHNSYGNKYSVTHVPTGLGIGVTVEGATRAKQIAASLHARKIDLGTVDMANPKAYARARKLVRSLAPKR